MLKVNPPAGGQNSKLNLAPQIIPNQQETSSVNLRDLQKYLTKSKSHDEVKIVFFGTSEFSAYILEKLLAFSQTDLQKEFLTQKDNRSLPKIYKVQVVITRPDKPVGRKQIVTPSPVSEVAQKYNIPVLKPAKLDDEFIESNLLLLESDIFIVAAYGKMLPQDLLEIPKMGAVNMHGSILPKYRGASPIQAAILNGDKTTGITIMLMDEQMDHGPIISTSEVSISGQDTFQTLSNKLAQTGTKDLIDILPKFIEGKVELKDQNHKEATFTKLIKKEDGYFDINNVPSPEILDRMIRAYYPWPNAWTKWNGRIVKFFPEKMVQMEGKKAISFKYFLNGYPNFPLKSI